MRYFALALLMAFGVPKVSKAQLHEAPKEQHYLKGDVGAEQTGSLSGTVKNKANHIVLSGATVQIWYNNQLLSTVKTNSNGFYEFKSLEAGVYMLKVYATNYVPYAIKELHIVEKKNIVADIELNKTPKPTKPYNENRHKVGKIHVQDN